MSEKHNPSDSATDTMRRYETNTDRVFSAPLTNDPEPEPVPATEPLPDTNKDDDAPIPMSDRQSPWQPEKGSEAESRTDENANTEAKEGGPEVRTV